MAKLVTLLEQHLEGQPPTVVTRYTYWWEAQLALVKLQECGLGTHLPVVSICANWKVEVAHADTHTKKCYVMHKNTLHNTLRSFRSIRQCKLDSTYDGSHGDYTDSAILWCTTPLLCQLHGHSPSSKQSSRYHSFN